MPELVACPSCGCKVQVAEMLLGRRTRCIGCGTVFVADEPRDEEPQQTGYPLTPNDDSDSPAKAQKQWLGPVRNRMPLCPRCHRPVSWEADACPHCCHEFASPHEAQQHQPARDCEDHRGGMLDGLGMASVLCAVLAPCTAGVTLIPALGMAIPTILMANIDLARMDRREMDEDGRHLTEMGKNKAIIGLVIAVVLGMFVVLFYVGQFL